MRYIDLDASSWTTALDFYDALLSSVGAPAWHGRSVDALVDSMIWGGINAIDPPYTIRIFGVSQVSDDVRADIELSRRALEDGRAFRERRGDAVQVRLQILE
jgi:hypothetical protein